MNDNFKEEYFNLVLRHFVSLRWIDRTPGERAAFLNGHGQPFAISGFVVSIRDEWFLITAGHIIENMLAAMGNGQVLTAFCLDDGMRPSAKFRDQMIAFDFAGAPKHFINDGQMGDYAFIHLRRYYRALLASNGIIPFEGIFGSVEDFHIFHVLGIPKQLITYIGEGKNIQEHNACAMFAVEPLDTGDLPPNLIKPGHYFYGKLPPASEMTQDNHHLTDIDGMSGGPILGWRINGGQLSYSVVALQSAWYPTSRVTIGCPIKRYLDAVTNQILAAVGGTSD